MPSPTDINFANIPPQSLEAEQCVIGSCIIDRKAVEVSSKLLTADDFYRDAHQTIFHHIREIYNKKEPVDLITLSNALRDSGVLDRIGGTSYLATIADLVPTTSNAPYYCEIVLEKSELRKIIVTASDVIKEAYTGQNSSEGIRQELVDFGLHGSSTNSDDGWYSTKDLIDETYDYIEERMKNRGKLSGIPSGFDSIDKHTDGYERGMLTIVAGRPSMGKTTFLLNVARNAAELGFKVGIFPLEESSLQHGIRLAASNSGYTMYQLRRGFIDTDDWDVIKLSMQGMSKLPIFFNKDHSVDINKLVTRIQALKARQGIDLVIVDHAGEVDVSDSPGTDNKRIGNVAHVCKRIARANDIAVILASQLSRGVEYREDKHPILSDLRESGELEQKADVVQLLYRPEYYFHDVQEWTNSCNKLKRSVTPYPSGIVEVITAKGRNIGNDTTSLFFDVNTNRMRDLTTVESEVLRGFIRKGNEEPEREEDQLGLNDGLDD